MATTLKCPNPSCPYLFDPTTVPAGVVLACPRCTMRFVLGPGAAGAHQTAAAAPRAQEPETPFGDMTPMAARRDGERGPRLPDRSSLLQTLLLVGVAVFGLVAAGIAVWYRLSPKPEETAPEPETQFPEMNFALVEPSKPWSQDGEILGQLGSPFIRVYGRDNPEAFIALGARDFVDRAPRRGELRDPLVLALGRLMSAGTLKEEPLPEKTEWLGKSAGGFTFRGQLKNGSVVEGEAYHVAHQGIGYWFLAWTGENQIYAEQKSAFAQVRSKCRLLGLRGSWSPKSTPIVRFTNNVLGYSILDGEGIWTEVTDEKEVKAEDPAADKYLTARIKQPGNDFPLKASLVIFVLDAMEGDPLEEARKYVEERENRDVENRGKTDFETHTEDSSFDAPNPVEGNAPYVLLKGLNSVSQRSTLWAVSAIRVGKKLVVASATCSFTPAERGKFERKFVVLVRSLRAGE